MAKETVLIKINETVELDDDDDELVRMPITTHV